MSRKGWLLFIALCVIWGIPYLLIRVAVRELPPPALIFLRTAPAALLLVPLALHRGELRPLLARWRWVAGYTVVEIALPWLLLAHAEVRISSSLAGLVVGAVPLIAAVLYRALGAGEQFDARRVAGLLVGFAGVAALVGIDVAGSDPLAVAEMLVVAVCYASGPLIISRPSGRTPHPGRHHRLAGADRRRLRAGGPADHAGVGLGADGGRRRHACRSSAPCSLSSCSSR